MKYILTIAREGGISRAAGKLFISQSALDQQLLKLENELGTQLFYRSRGNFAPTEAGKVYLDYAKRMVDMKEEAYRVIHDMAENQRGTLSLAFAPERGMEMFMSVYPRFYQRYPAISVNPREINVKQQIEMLQNDKLDLGFLYVREPEIPGLNCTPLLREEFLLITPRDHPLAAQAAPPGEPLTVLDARVLRDMTFCLIYRSSTQREVIDPLFERNGVKPKIFLETASNRANISMVQNGLSCSIVPDHYARRLPDVARFRLADRPEWTVAACSRRGRYLSKAARYFAELAGDYFQSEPDRPV